MNICVRVEDKDNVTVEIYPLLFCVSYKKNIVCFAGAVTIKCIFSLEVLGFALELILYKIEPLRKN